MKLKSDAFGDFKVVTQRINDLAYPARRKGRGSASEVKARHSLFSPQCAPHHMNLFDESIDVAVKLLLTIDFLAIGAEVTYGPAKGDMDIEP